MLNIKSPHQKTKKVRAWTQVCHGKIQEYDIEVEVKGHRPFSMVQDTSPLCDLPTGKISKAYIERQTKVTAQIQVCHRKTGI